MLWQSDKRNNHHHRQHWSAKKGQNQTGIKRRKNKPNLAAGTRGETKQAETQTHMNWTANILHTFEQVQNLWDLPGYVEAAPVPYTHRCEGKIWIGMDNTSPVSQCLTHIQLSPEWCKKIQESHVSKFNTQLYEWICKLTRLMALPLKFKLRYLAIHDFFLVVYRLISLYTREFKAWEQVCSFWFFVCSIFLFSKKTLTCNPLAAIHWVSSHGSCPCDLHVQRPVGPGPIVHRDIPRHESLRSPAAMLTTLVLICDDMRWCHMLRNCTI